MVRDASIIRVMRALELAFTRRGTKMRRLTLPILLASVVSGIGAVAQTTASNPTAADYAAATRLLYPNLQGLVSNETVFPHWIGDTGRFWYQRDGQEGRELVVVSRDGARARAFDPSAMARALSPLTGTAAGTGLPSELTDLGLSDDLKTFHATFRGKRLGCDIETKRCRALDVSVLAADLLPSPDGRRALLTRGNNLMVRDLLTGEEHALTTDGEDALSWAKTPYFSSFMTLPMLKAGPPSAPFQTYWSPDGRYVIAPRIDERGVALWPYVEWVPPEGSRRPVVHQVRVPLPGDRATVKVEYFLFDLQTGRRTALRLPEGYPELSWPSGWAPVLGWSRHRRQAFILSRTPGWKKAAVFRVDLATGAVTTVLEEAAATRFEFNPFWAPSNVRLVGDGEEIVWVSDRTGWFQLYLYPTREIAASLIQRAEKAGCKAILFTVDLPVLGKRERDRRNGVTIPPPPFVEANFVGIEMKGHAWRTVTWDDVDWLRSITSLPIVIKGILTAEDALLALEHGVSGIVVSNHGGRQLDSAVTGIEALPEIVEAVAGRCEVYMDGGIRRGTDVLKALALGARAVLVGRPILWGLAVDGARGVQHVLEILRAELELAMKLSGCPDLSSINRSLVKLT